MKGTMKKIISVVLALAMIVTGLQYSPRTTVSAASDGTITYNYKTYTIHITSTDGITGAFMSGVNGNPGFTFAWDSVGGGDNILKPVIKKDGNTVATLNNIGNGGSINGSELASKDLQNGNYDIEFVGSGALEGKKPTATLTVSNEETTAFVEGTELIPAGNQNSSTLNVPAYNSGEPYGYEYKIQNLSITENKWYVAKYTVTSNITKKFELRLQDATDGHADYTDPAGFVVTEALAGQPTTVTKVFRATRSTSGAIFDVCMGYVDNTTVGAAEVQVTNVSLKAYSTQAAAEATTTEAQTTTQAPQETTTEQQLEWHTDANLTAYFGEGARYAYVSSNPGNNADKFLGGNFTFNAENMNCTTGSYGNSHTYSFNGKSVNSSDSAYTVGENIAYSKFNPGRNTAVFTGHYTADNSDINVTCTMYIEVPNKPYDLSINDYSSKTGKYIAKFKEANDMDHYRVYVDGNATDITVGGSGDFFTVDELKNKNITTGNHTITIKGVDAEDNETDASSSASVNVPENAGTYGDIAQIYIQTDSTNLSPTPQDGKDVITKDGTGKQMAAITVIDKDGVQNPFKKYEDKDKTTVKVRGNSTSNAVKKAYNITFDKGVDLFGLDGSNKPAKKWSLLANAFDKSLIRNALGFDIAHHVWADNTTPDYNSNCKFVDLYFNGVYLGNYLLIESVETGAGRVNIPAEDYENHDSHVSEALLELEQIHAIGEEAHFTTSEYKETFIFGSPETAGDYGDNTELFNEKVSAVQDIFNNFETDLKAKNWTKIQADIDVDSFVKFYLVSEIMTTKDFNQSSTRFYVHNDKIYGGPLWDMDYSSDNNLDNPAYTLEYQKRMSWFNDLMEIPEFKAAVVSEYKAIRSYVMSLYTDNGGIDTMVAGIANSAVRNYSVANGSGWSIDTRDNGDGYGYLSRAGVTPYTSYNDVNDSTSAVAQVKNYFKKRIEGLDETWDVSYEVSISTENDEVVVSWDAMEGATGYRLTFSGKYIAPVSPTPLLAANPLMAVQQIADDYTTQTEDVGAGVTSYNLTDAGYEVENGTDITVAYSTDNGNTYTALASAQYNAAPAEQGYENITDWTKLSGTSESGASIYVPTEMITNNLFGNAGLRGFYGAGKTNRWNITADVGIDTVPVFGFCTTGTNASDVIVNGTTYSGHDVSVTTAVAVADTVYINQNLIDAAEGETNYYQITATGSNTGTFWVKVVGAGAAPERNDSGWVAFMDGGNSKNEDAAGNTYYVIDEFKNSIGNKANFGLYDNTAALQQPGWGAAFAGENANDPIISVIFGIQSITKLTVDNTEYPKDGISIGNGGDILYAKQSLFTLGQNEDYHIFKLKVDFTTGDTRTFYMKVEKSIYVDTLEPLDDNDIPDNIEWIDFAGTENHEYQYFYPSEYVSKKADGANVNHENGTQLYLPQAGVAAPYKRVLIDNYIYTNSGAGYVAILKTDLTENGVYRVDITDANSTPVTVYVKKNSATNYTPTGLAVAQNGTVTWTPSADATTAGATYSVTFNGNTVNNITTGTASLDLTGVAYGTYPVVLKTFVDGNEVDSQTIQFVYKDPESVESTLHGTGNIQLAWEKERCDYLTWDAVADSTYAVYVDGKLWKDNITETSYNVPAYALVDTENGTDDKNNQKQTRGHHVITVAAIPTGQTAPELLENVNTKRIIGTDDFTLNLNYIYGDETDIWNTTGVPSKWNFTITPEDGETSGLKATYNNDGSVSITNIQSAAEWKAKAAIYDRRLDVEDQGGLVNVSFDLTITDGDIINTIKNNPGSLKIGIKCVADEVANENGNYTYAGRNYNLTQEQIDAGLRWVYQDPSEDGDEARYPFVYDEQTGNAVLHYSLTFTPVQDTYDLLFDLHGLNGASITFSDAVEKDIYKVTHALGSPIPNGENIANSSIQVGWNTNVPDHLANNYYYKVYIDGTKVSDNATLDDIYTGYDAGEHTVKVESYYGLPAGDGQEETGVKTGEETATVTIVQEEKANLVISDIKITDNNGNNENGIFYVGDTIKIKVTTKNIGNVPAAPSVDNLTTWLYKKSVNDNAESNVDTGWKILFNAASGESIPVGGTRDAEYTYTIGAGDVGIVTFRGVADIDKHVDELSENDNEKITRFKFYEQPKELTLTNDGTAVTATWPTVTGTPDSVKLKYTTSDNQEHEITIPAASTSYTFPADVVLKNNTQVIVETVYGNDVINHAVGIAKADLVATSVGTSGDTANLDADNNIVFVVKNIGTAQAVTNDLVIWASDGSWTNYKAGISIDLGPNETITDSVTGYHPTTTGTKTLNYKVDERNTVVESNEENNNDTFEVVVAEAASPDLIIDSLTIDKDAYKVGDVIHVRMVMKNIGAVEATAAGNIVEKLVINGENGAWSTEGIHTLAPYDAENPEENVIDYTFNYTVTQADYERGYIDIAGRADADGIIAEGTAGEANNLTESTRVKVVDSGVLTLSNNNDIVSATFTEGQKATGYKISYTSNGTVYTEEIITSGVGANAIYDSENGTYTYTFSRPLDQVTNVNITATYDDSITALSSYYDYATEVAKADLIITQVVSSTNDYKVKVPFTLTATVKNIGTAQVMPSPTQEDDVTKDYAYWLGINMPAVGNDIEQVIGTHTIAGLTVGNTVDLQIVDVNVLKEGSYDIVINADDLGYVQQEGAGHVEELNETNNSFTFPITAIFVQEPMDWTTFYQSTSVVSGDDVLTNGNKEAKGNVSNLPDGTKVINMNNGSDWRPIEFKVIATNIDDMNYEDIVNKWEGYGGVYTAIGINNNYPMIQSDEHGVTSKFEFAQVHESDIENYDYEDDDIVYTERHGGDGLIQTFDGNGWQFHTRSFAAGKYYIAKITNKDGSNPNNYIVIAFRVPGNLDKWVKANASDASDPDKLPLSFHKADNIVDGSLYYDATDLGLAGIATYNGNHISITTDGTCTLNTDVNEQGNIEQGGDGENWHMTIQYGHLDNNGEFVAGISDEDLDEIGNDPGEIRLNPTAEVFGTQGKNTILIKFPELMQQLPIHSPKGGESDNEYYLLKVYYDDVNHAGKYVNIPLRMVTNVPQINEPQNYSVWSGTDAFYVSFTETQHQMYQDYTYTFYLGDEKVTGVKKDDVVLDGDVATEGGIYELPVDAETKEKLQIDGSEFTVKVKAEWCQQEVTLSKDYKVELKDGTVDIEGFQINTNKEKGGVSEFMPSFRVISHSSKNFLSGEEGAQKLHAAVETGTIYACAELGATVNEDTMTLESAEADGNINTGIIGYHAAQTLHGWGGLETTTNYFSLSVKEMAYDFDRLQRQYSFRAYVVLDNGEVRYGDHIYTVSTYDIAKNLYDNQKMPTVEAHNFLYDQVLNVVKMFENSKQIANAMNKALRPQYGTIDQATYQRYIQDIRKDFEYYARGIAKYGYDYSNREHNDFTSVLLGETKQAELLAALNNAQDANYDTIFDWIVNEVSHYDNKGVAYQGFYEQVEYAWGKAISTDFDAEE